MILTEAELIRWGKRVGEEVLTPNFVTLTGPLGAGKSVLARAVALGAGVHGNIPSPTFNLIFRYEGRRGIQVVHMDLYRLTHPDELRELGWEELGQPRDLVLLEWPDRAGSELPPDRWEVELGIPNVRVPLREVSVTRVGSPLPLPGFPVEMEP
jgi:tRNA threonylcarbamoyl adenosine modification protein YjeE